MIANAVGLIKNVLLSAFASIANQWQDILSKSNTNADNEVKSGGMRIGNSWITALYNAIKGRQSEIQQVMEETVNKGSQNVNNTLTPKNTNNLSNVDTSPLNQIYNSGIYHTQEQWNKEADIFTTALDKMRNSGIAFSTEINTAAYALETRIRQGSLSAYEAGQQIIPMFNQVGAIAEVNTSKISNFWSELQNKNSNWSRGLTGLAQSLTMVGMLLNKDTESGRILSGVMTGLGGTLQTGISAVRVFNGDLSAMPQLVMGIANIINGISIGWEDSAEKLERLSKSAENLTNQSKQAKAEYNNLERSFDKVEELEKKRYESAEAAEEYQSAVDELVEQFPQLISGMDAAGNVMIDTKNKELVLSNAREKSAEAAIQAAQAEIALSKERAAQARNEAKALLQESSETVKTAMNRVQIKGFGSSQALLDGLNNIIQTDESADNAYQKLAQLAEMKIQPEEYDFSFIKEFVSEQGDTFNLKAGEFTRALFSDEYRNNLNKTQQNTYDALREIWEGNIDEIQILAMDTYNLADQIGQMSLEELTSEENQGKIQEFKENVNKILQNENYADFFSDEAKALEVFGEAIDKVSEAVGFDTEIEGYTKLIVGSLLKTKSSLDKSLSFITDSPELLTLANKKITQAVSDANLKLDEKGGVLGAQSIVDEVSEEYSSFWNGLNSIQQELVNDWISNSDYSLTDIFRLAKQEQIDISPIASELVDDTGKKIREEIIKNLQSYLNLNEEAFEPLLAAVENMKAVETSEADRSFVNDAIAQINTLTKSGYATEAIQVGKQAAETLIALQSLNTESSQAVMQIIRNNGIASKDAINDAREEIIGDDSINEDVKQVALTFLDTVYDALSYNVVLSIQSATDKIVQDSENLEKSIKDLSNGLSISDAVEAIEKINAAREQSLNDDGQRVSLADFKEKNGKYYLKDPKIRQEYISTLIDGINSDVANIRAEINKYSPDNSTYQNEIQKLSKEAKELEVASLKTFEVEDFGVIVETLNSLGLINKFTEDGKAVFQFTEEGLQQFQQADNTILQYIYDTLNDRAVTLEELATNLEQSLPAQIALESGDYQGYIQNLTGIIANINEVDLSWIAQGKEYAQLDYQTQLKPLKDKLNSVYSNLISDALSKGLDNIRPEDYEGLIGDTYDTSITNLTGFVKRYAALAGKSLEETNDLIIQAMEKDAAATSGAAADALKDVTFLTKDIAYASLETLNQLANALGVGVETLFDASSYNAALDAYKVDMGALAAAGLADIENASNVVADSIVNFLKSISDAIGKGLKGQLSYAERDNLISNLQSRGIDTSKLDFTPTVEGLKLSDAAATDLYYQLSAIDGLQASLVFDALRSSLEQAGKGLENISASTARVSETQRKLAENLQDIARLRESGASSDDSRIKAIEAENQGLKQQLTLYQQIQRAQMQDASSYDFMGRKLPEYLQGPENYWNATGKAFKVMNQAGKTGKMEIDDFYNIVNEMSNLATISGNELEFMGMKIDGSAEKTAALIEKGMDYLTNIDGEGVKLNMKQFATDMQVGASDMGEGFDDAIKSMAKSQIKMLDGMIQLLETIVAMEQLGDIDVDGDNILDIGEIFKVKYDEKGFQLNEKYWDEFTDQYKTIAQKIMTAAEETPELAKALKQFKINGISLHEMFQDALDNGVKDLPIDAEAYTAAMNAVYQAAISGDFDTDNIMQSIQNVLAGTGQTFELDMGDGTKIAVGFGAIVETDEQGKYVYGDQTFDTPELAVKAAALEQFTGEESIIEGDEVYQWTYTEDVQIKTTLNDVGEPVYEFDGQTYDTQNAAVQAAYKKYVSETPNSERLTQEAWQAQYNIELQTKLITDVGSIDRSSIDKFLTTSKEDIQKKIEGSTDGTIEIEGIEFELGDTTTPEQLKQQVLDSLNLSDMATGVAAGITQAFEGEAGTKISDAITNGIQNAFTIEEGVDVPTLTVNPASFIVNLNGVTPKIEGLDENQPLTIENVEAKITSYIDTDASIEQLNAIKELEGWITSYTENGATITNPTLLHALDGWITSYIEASPTMNTESLTKLTGIIKAFEAIAPVPTFPQLMALTAYVNTFATNPDATVDQAKIAALTAYISFFDASTATNNPEDFVNGLTAIITTFSEDANDPNDFVSNLTGLITKFVESDNVNKPEALNNITAYITKYANANGVDPNALVSNLIGILKLSANITTYGDGFVNGTAEVNGDLNLTATLDSNDIKSQYDTAKDIIEKDPIKVQAILDNPDLNWSPSYKTDTSYNANYTETASVNTTIDTSGIESFVTAAQKAAQQISDVASSIDEITTDKIDAIKTAEESIEHSNVDDIATAQSQIRSDRVEAIRTAASLIDASHAQAAQRAINSIGGTMSIGINVGVNVTGAGVANGTIGSLNVNRGTVSGGGNRARWTQNYAYATGNKRTLMGELGTELVVTDGHYFLVGQNGPEFVDLAADAIVFNHIQTKKLLDKGSIPTRGTPVTNERRATSMATGNVEGPAMASASAALAALKQIRAMWQRLKDASLKDLGAGAGGAGGGGGGGGGDDKELAAITAEIEEWYNWLRKIDELQKQLNLKEKQYELLMNDRIANGNKIYQNLKAQNASLKEEMSLHKGLYEAQEARYEEERRKMEENPVFNALYSFNKETGLLQRAGDEAFTNFLKQKGDAETAAQIGGGNIQIVTTKEQTEEEKKEGKEKETETTTFTIPTNGMELLRQLTSQEVNGQSAYTLDQQFEILKKLGFGDWMQYDTENNQIFKDINETSQEERQKAVETFIARWENAPDYFIGIKDSIQEHKEAELDALNKIYENEQKIIDNQLDLENKVMTAIEDLRQAEIDELQKQRDAFSDQADKLVNGLTDSLNKERQMYQSEQSQQDIQKLQRQLAILQRSGGSMSQIQNLQNQLAAKQQEAYFTERQQQIDAIKEASDKQIDRLDQQIELMTETLTYQKENGLLWERAHEIMQGTPEQIAEFIESNTKEYKEKSITELQNIQTADLQSAQLYKASVDDGFDVTNVSISDTADTISETEAGNKDQIIDKIEETKNEVATAVDDKKRESKSGGGGGSGGSSGGGGSGGGSGNSSDFDVLNSMLLDDAESTENFRNAKAKKKAVTKTASAVSATVNSIKNTVNTVASTIKKAINGTKTSNKKEVVKPAEKKKKQQRFATGGLNTEAGWHYLDGTPSRPEYVLNAEQTDILRTALLGTHPVAASLNRAAYGSINGMANSSTYSTVSNEGNITIENVEMNLNVPTIANDYDAKRAGEMAFNEMVKIARKTGTRSLSRR